MGKRNTIIRHDESVWNYPTIEDEQYTEKKICKFIVTNSD